MGEMLTETLEKLEHDGHTIIYANYRGLTGDSYVDEIKVNASAVRKLADEGERQQLRLIDIRDGFIGWEVYSEIIKASKQMKPYTRATALVLNSGVRMKMMKGFNTVTGLGARPFETVEEAKDWLVKQAK